jgi:hypothetical protein
MAAASRGKKQSPETIAKRVAANPNRKRTLEQIAKMKAEKEKARKAKQVMPLFESYGVSWS